MLFTSIYTLDNNERKKMAIARQIQMIDADAEEIAKY